MRESAVNCREQGRILRTAFRPAARNRPRGRAAHADHRRSGDPRAAGGAASSSPASSTACRISRRWRRVVRSGTRMQMEGLAMTGAWVDRDTGPGLHHRAGDGRLERPVRHAQARRAGDPDGPDRHADRNRRRRNRGAVRRRPGQRGAVFHRRRVPRRGLEGALLRRLQEGHRPLQGRRHRERRRHRGLVLRRGARLQARPAAGPQLRRQHRPGDGRLRRGPPGRALDPPRRRRPPDRHRLGPHDGRRGEGAPRRAEAAPEAARTSPSAPSTRRCNA